MTFDPRSYWAGRCAKQGPAYVTNAARIARDPSWAERQLDAFTAAIPVESLRGAVVLDFGCGVGRLSPFVAQHATFYDGVDIVEEAIVIADREHGRPAGKVGKDCAVTFHHLAEDRLPFDAGTFDTILAVTVFQHMPDRDLRIWADELHRVGVAGATYVIIDARPRESSAEHMFHRAPRTIEHALGITLIVERPVEVDGIDHQHLLVGTKI